MTIGNKTQYPASANFRFPLKKIKNVKNLFEVVFFFHIKICFVTQKQTVKVFYTKDRRNIEGLPRREGVLHTFRMQKTL